MRERESAPTRRIYESDASYSSFEARGGLSRSEMEEIVPHFDLLDDVTDAGWHTGAGKETHEECRARSATYFGAKCLHADPLFLKKSFFFWHTNK